MNDLPTRLRDAPIVEALLEVRFSSSEPPELLIAVLAGNPNWTQYTTQRLPTADIPLPIRAKDPNLAYVPTFERLAMDGSRTARFGPNVLSFHILGPYPGWTVAGPEFAGIVDYLFRKVPALSLKRLGFRYVNVLTATRHFVPSITGLEFAASIRREALSPPLTASFRRQHGDSHICQVSIASPEFVEAANNVAAEMNALVDVDVYTPPVCPIEGLENTQLWVEKAHEILKIEFFRLIPKETLDKLRDDT